MYLADGNAELVKVKRIPGLCGAFPEEKCLERAGGSGFLVSRQPGVLPEETSLPDRRGARNGRVRCGLSVSARHL